MAEPTTRQFLRRRAKIAAAVAGSLLVLSFLYFRFFPPGPCIVCHRFVDGTITQWMLETTNQVWLPNVNGKSADSLALLSSYYGGDLDELRDYRYIPGLKTDDPDDLVWFYMIRPSRRTWHGDPYVPWHPKLWIVLSHRGMMEGGGGELSELLTTAELQTRLKATIDFLKKNQRPGWQNAETEHTAFLNSLKE